MVVEEDTEVAVTEVAEEDTVVVVEVGDTEAEDIEILYHFLKTRSVTAF